MEMTETTALSAQLLKEGFHVKSEVVSDIVEDGTTTLSGVRAALLDTDFRSAGVKFLPKTAASYLKLEGRMVLQIVSIRNVCRPARVSRFDTGDGGNRILLLVLTDGVTTCKAVEYTPIPAFSGVLLPGVKVAVSGAEVRNGFLLLTAANTEVLGGTVRHAVAEWKAQQARRDIMYNSTGAPRFVVLTPEMARKHKASSLQPKQGKETSVPAVQPKAEQAATRAPLAVTAEIASGPAAQPQPQPQPQTQHQHNRSALQRDGVENAQILRPDAGSEVPARKVRIERQSQRQGAQQQTRKEEPKQPRQQQQRAPPKPQLPRTLPQQPQLQQPPVQHQPPQAHSKPQPSPQQQEQKQRKLIITRKVQPSLEQQQPPQPQSQPLQPAVETVAQPKESKGLRITRRTAQ